MQNEDEIFRTYVFKRLEEDVSTEYRETLNPYQESHLAGSKSLDYLSEISGIRITDVAPKWITEESSEEGTGYYRDEPERVYVIDIKDVLDARAKDIVAITKKFSPDLAQKIQTFEAETKYLYAPAFSSKRDISIHLQRVLPLFDSPDKTDKKIRILINRRLHELNAIPLEQKAERQVKKELKKDKEQKQFYHLISQLYTPKPTMDQIALYIQLYNLVGSHNPEDVRGFIKGDGYKMTPSLKGRIHRELKRDIAQQIKSLYDFELKNESKWWQQEVDALNQSLIRSNDKKRLLGPQGAFAKGGLYGPDSKFAVNTLQQQNAPKLQTPKYQMPPVSQSSKTQETVVELSLFSDKDFEY